MLAHFEMQSIIIVLGSLIFCRLGIELVSLGFQERQNVHVAGWFRKGGSSTRYCFYSGISPRDAVAVLVAHSGAKGAAGCKKQSILVG